MKNKKEVENTMTECERLQIIYDALDCDSKWEIKSLIELFKAYKIDVTASMVQKDIMTLSKEIVLTKTKSEPIQYSRKTDEYKEIMENIEAIKKTKDFKTLNHLRTLERIHRKEILLLTEILIRNLLKFDLMPESIEHPWAYFSLTEEVVNSLEMTLDYSESVITLMNEDRTYQYARQGAATDLNVRAEIFPEKCPYNLVEIIKEKKHVIFELEDMFFCW